MTEENKREKEFREFLEARDKIDDIVSEVFHDYCKVFGFFFGYGVQSWEEAGKENIYIVQDTSCMGCSSTDSHVLPMEYIFYDRDKRLKIMTRDAEKARKKKERRDREAAARELKEAEARVKRLREKLRS